jgi:hypothetical protein
MTRTRPYTGASVLVLAGLIGWMAPLGAHAAESSRRHLDVHVFAHVTSDLTILRIDPQK